MRNGNDEKLFVQLIKYEQICYKKWLGQVIEVTMCMPFTEDWPNNLCGGKGKDKC